jgi:hypothetical protein
MIEIVFSQKIIAYRFEWSLAIMLRCHIDYQAQYAKPTLIK